MKAVHIWQLCVTTSLPDNIITQLPRIGDSVNKQTSSENCADMFCLAYKTKWANLQKIPENTNSKMKIAAA